MSVFAVGKAAAPMMRAWLRATRSDVREAVAVVPAVPTDASPEVAWIAAGHPVPDAASVTAGERALALARAVPHEGTLVVLLSGGASALLSAPVAAVPLADKQEASRRLLASGADIHDLNCVRKHLSRVKGGWLAATCAGSVLTLAISDVVGDTPSVIGSGPTVGDPTTFGDALARLDRWGGRDAYPARVQSCLEHGAAGARPETPKPGDARLARATYHVIGGRSQALDGAGAEAEALGYHVHVLDAPITGVARDRAPAYLGQVRAVARELPRPACILSGGETTVHVRGRGRGGRNQEFALAVVDDLATLGSEVALLSLGTDGIDGPTDAAGAIVDTTTARRARAAGLVPAQFLDNNDAYRFFEAVGDLVRTGPTGANVGDLQIALLGA